MSKRNSPAVRPAKADEWSILLATTDAAKGWDVLCKQQPEPLASLYDSLTAGPRRSANRERQGPLKSELATAVIKGETGPQWQYELSGGGRVWYAIDDTNRTVWITKASPRHPNETK